MAQADNHKLRELVNQTTETALSLDKFQPVKIINFSATYDNSKYIYETDWAISTSADIVITLKNIPDNYINKNRVQLLFRYLALGDLPSWTVPVSATSKILIIKKNEDYDFHINLGYALGEYKIIISFLNPNSYYEIRTRKT